MKLACWRLAVERESEREVAPKPFVATGNGEVGHRKAVVQGDMGERLCRVDDDEPQFVLRRIAATMSPIGKSCSQIVNRRQE